MIRKCLRMMVFICSALTIMASGYTQFGYAQDSQNKIQKSTIYYGCQQYSGVFHCDRIHNKFEGFRIKSNSTTLYHAEAMPEFVPGKEGSAIQMYANHRKSIIFSNTSDVSPKQFSVAFWMKGTKLLDKTNSPDVGHVVSHYNDNLTAGWSINAHNLQNLRKEAISFVVYNDNGQAFSPLDVPIFHKNSFVHIVGTFNGSHVKVYKDGALFGEAKFEGAYNNHINFPLTLGVSSARPLQFFGTGSIDDLRYYDKALSTSEIKQIYNHEDQLTSTISNDLIGRWKFNGNLNDSSGNNHHGTQRTLITSMVFAPDGRLFFSEKDTGHIKVMKDGRVNSKPFATISDYYSNWEQGLLGLAIDPDFNDNHFVYLFYTSVNKKNGTPFNRIVRFTEVDSYAKDKVVIFDNIPASKGYHSGGAMAFGPDDKLYVTIGDATQNTACGNLPNSTGATCPAQDPSSLLGKVLRLNRDGSIPKDNPYRDSPVFNIGHLNMYGIAFDESGFGLVAENGRYQYDEINTIERAANYGSPTIQIPDTDPELSHNSSKPLRSYYDAQCLTSLIFYSGDKISQLKGKFLFGTFKSANPIYALQVDKDSKQVVGELAIFLNKSLNNQVVSLAQSPTGEIYYASFDINKLDFVNTTNKLQTLFPIELNYSDPIINITHLSFNPSKKEIIIDVDRVNKYVLIKNQNINANDSISDLTVTIPKALLYQIDNVTSDYNNMTGIQSEKIDFTVQDDRGNETVVNISFKDNDQQRLFISGKSSSYNLPNPHSLQS